MRQRIVRCLLLALALGGADERVAAAQGDQLPDLGGLLVSTQSRPSFSIVGAGARAAGMGGAFTAVADDASAASFNPAGLALLVKPEASLVVDGRRRSEQHGGFASADGGEIFPPSSTSFSTVNPNFAAFTVPFAVADRNLSLQVSYQRLIDFDYRGSRTLVERDAAGEQVALVSQRLDQSGAVATYSLAGAYQLTGRLSLGLTVSRWQGSWRFSSNLREQPVGESMRQLRLAQDNSWSGWNATVGALLRYRYLNIGATFRSSFTGDYTVTSEVDAANVGGFATPARVDATLTWPASWTAGVAIKPTEVWILTADFAEYDWDDMLIGGLGPNGDQEVNFFDLRPPESSTTRNTAEWRFGTEHTFFPGRALVTARAGYFVQPRPQLLAPSDEKSSVRGWSVGAGIRAGQVSIDLAYQRARATSHTLELVDPLALGGTATTLPEAAVRADEDRIYLSVLYQFATRQSLRRMLHFLFVGPLDDDAAAKGKG
jgi:long-chain fatty acid transport protein